MNVFIDESGQFAAHQKAKDPYECFLAVGMIDEVLAIFEEQYRDKGKEFLRKNSDNLFKLLNENNCKVFAVFYNSNFSSKAEIEEHRKDYIESIRQGIGTHPDFLSEEVEPHITILSNVKPDLYIKALLMIHLLENILRGICCESMQFLDDDLTFFNFVCDAVADSIKPTITHFSLFSMFCRSSKNPIKFDNKANLKHFIHGDGKYLDAASLLENISFVDSKTSIGVQIADVLVNQLHRILNDKTTDYDKSIWKNLLSNPYGLDDKHFNMGRKFIDSPISESALDFIDSIRNDDQ